MTMRFRVIAAFLSCFVVHQCLHAQKNIYQFSHLDITNGLSNNRVSCIFKDANGFMWFGTTSGLNRYDGYKFKIFKHEPNDHNSLIDNNILHIDEGPDKSMWLFTHSGVSVYDSNTESFSDDLPNELSHYRVPAGQLNAIRKDHNGNFWFLTDKGIYLYKTQLKTTYSYNMSATSPIVLHSNNVTDVVDGGDRLWLMYNDGVIDEVNENANHLLVRMTRLNTTTGGKQEVYSAVLGADNKLWIYAAGTSEGVYCYDIVTRALSHYGKDTPEINLNTNVINGIVQGNDDGATPCLSNLL